MEELKQEMRKVATKISSTDSSRTQAGIAYALLSFVEIIQTHEIAISGPDYPRIIRLKKKNEEK